MYHLYEERRLRFVLLLLGIPPAGVASKRTPLVECGDDRAFRHMLTFSLAYARDAGAILDERLVGGVENFSQPFINVNVR